MTRSFLMRICLCSAIATTALTASTAREEDFSTGNLRDRGLSLGSHKDQFFTLVSAADFTLMNGVTVNEASSEGLRTVGQLDRGDFMAYRIDLPSTAVYQLQMYVSSPDGEGSLSVKNMETDEIYDTIDELPVTGEWNEWSVVSRNMTLPEGTSVMKIEVIESGCDLQWLSLQQLDTPSLDESSVSPDSPSQNVTSSISDASSQNTSIVEPSLSEPNVSTAMPTVSEQNSATAAPTLREQMSNTTLPPQVLCLESVAAVDYISMNGSDVTEDKDFVKLYAGDWAAYTITAPYDGPYMLQLSAMDTQGGGALEVRDMENNQHYAVVQNIRDSRMWTNVNTVMDLSAGSHTLQVRVLNGCWNLASLCLQDVESSQGSSESCGCGGGCGCGGLTQPEIHVHNHIYSSGGGYNYGVTGSGNIGGYPAAPYQNAGTGSGNNIGGYPAAPYPNAGTGGGNNGGYPAAPYSNTGTGSGSNVNLGAVPNSGTPNSGFPSGPNNGFPSNGLPSGPNSGVPNNGLPSGPNNGMPNNGLPSSGLPSGPNSGVPNSGAPSGPNTGVPNSGPNVPPDSGVPNAGAPNAGAPGDPNSGGNVPPDSGKPSAPGLPTSGDPGPSNSGGPGDPSAPVLPSSPAAPSDPALPAGPANPALPAEPADPSLPASPADPALPASPANPALPASPANPALPAPPSDPSAPSNPILPSSEAGSCDVVIPANNYRAMSGVDSEASTEGLTNVGWFDPGDWLEYDVNLPTAGTYRMSYRIASPDGGGSFQVTSQDMSQVYGAVNSLTPSGGWQSWYTDATDVMLPAGPQTLRINISDGGWNLAWLCFTAVR